MARNTNDGMFNIYYINYAKAYEISMLLDNKVLGTTTHEKGNQMEASGAVEADAKKLSDVPFVGKFLPTLELDGEFNGMRSKKVIDVFNVVSTKSTILRPIYNQAKCISDMSKCSIGELIKLDGIALQITNPNDVIGAKALLSGVISQIPIDGIGKMDFTALMEVFLKDAAYILEGVKMHNKGKKQSFMMKIPMQAESEMESQYGVSDIEVGEMSVIGIYKGAFERSSIEQKINRMKSLQRGNEKNEVAETLDASDIEDGQKEIEEKDSNQTHYIDVIAIIQELKL